MQEAFGQALAYSSTIEPPPPFIIVTDIGYCFDLYAAFDGTRNYRKFPDALSSRINIESLERDSRNVELLRAIFTDPHALDPSKRARNSAPEGISTPPAGVDRHDPQRRRRGRACRASTTNGGRS